MQLQYRKREAASSTREHMLSAAKKRIFPKLVVLRNPFLPDGPGDCGPPLSKYESDVQTQPGHIDKIRPRRPPAQLSHLRIVTA